MRGYWVLLATGDGVTKQTAETRDVDQQTTRPLRTIELFAGAGGASLALQWLIGCQTVCYVEWDRYCQRVLEARISDRLLHDAPIWDDVCTFDAWPWRNRVDLVCAGFPCQPFSVAGKQRAGFDPKNQWPATIDVIRVVRPKYVFLENVAGLLAGSHGYFGTILRELAKAGYDAAWEVLSAAECGAPHRRDRLWVLATNTDRDGKHAVPVDAEVAIAPQSAGWWEAEPGVGRVVDGMAHRMDRLKALGNGWVPVVGSSAWDILRRVTV